MRLTKEDMDKWLLEDGKGIILIGQFESTKVNTLFQCSNGHRWTTTPNSIRNGRGCPICSNRYTQTKEEFSQWLVETNRGIDLIGDYVNTKTKTIFKCNNGHEWATTPNSIKIGTNCPTCFQQSQPSTDNFREWLIFDGRGISLVGEYTNARTNTNFRCVYGHEWSSTPDNIKRGSGCPICAKYGFDPLKSAWEYAFTRDGYLKYGITNDLTRRLNEHRRYGEITLVHERYHEIGQLALNWEINIKQTFGGRYATKEQCPDGYTETLPLSLLANLTINNSY